MAAILRRAQPFLHQTRGNVRNLSRENQLMSKACFSSTGRQSFSADGKNSDRVFASYNIYKGKASLSVSPRLPEFSKIDSGGLVVNRQGSVMLSFSPAIGERKYDWEKKQLFALSSTEVGSLISLGPQESCEFFHDPSMKSSNAGQVAKTLQVKPYGDGSDYFFSLSVKNKILNTTDRLTVPVSKAEFAVMRTAFSFVLPHIMGWDRFTNQPPKVIEDNAGSIVDPQHQGLEWDR